MNAAATTATRRLLAASAMLAGALLPASPAKAQNCTASAAPVAFGNYNVFSALPTDSTGTVTLSCAPNLVSLLLGYSIALSPGGSGSFAARRMSNGAGTLNYQLYTGLLHTTVWGDGTGGSSVVSGGLTLSVLTGVNVSHTVYGRIPAQQAAAQPGAHADTITVTISY